MARILRIREDIIKPLSCQIYNEYKAKILGRVSNEIIPRPWMKYREIEIVEEILKRLQPQKCLEWGTGYSTIYLPNFVSENSNWISVEHERDWAIKIKNINQKLNVKIFHIQPNHFPWTDEDGDGAYSDLRDYIEFPAKFGNFDFILVDGAGRKGCLIKACELVKNGGVVILHDANSNYYHEPFALYKYYVLFKDYRQNTGGLWVGSKGININEMLDVDRHKKLWQVYNRVGKVLRALKLRRFQK